LELLLPRHVSRADVSRDNVLKGYDISRGTLLEILPNRENSATNLEENDVSRGPNVSGQLAITFSERELEVLCTPDSYRTRPPRSLPPLHPLQLSLLIKLHNTIDLSIRMHMILS
jgi:hypothetical protein